MTLLKRLRAWWQAYRALSQLTRFNQGFEFADKLLSEGKDRQVEHYVGIGLQFDPDDFDRGMAEALRLHRRGRS